MPFIKLRGKHVRFPVRTRRSLIMIMMVVICDDDDDDNNNNNNKIERTNKTKNHSPFLDETL